jgi:hypothetical protein
MLPRTATCFTSNNDIAGLQVERLQVPGQVRYGIGGQGIALGSGGLSSTFAFFGPYANADISLPITLSAPQAWSIDGGGVGLSGGVTGPSNALAIDIRDSSRLSLEGQNEVGLVSVQGVTSLASSSVLELNGDDATLNASSGHPVHLEGLQLIGAGTIGPLTARGATIRPFQQGRPVAVLQVNGDVTLGPDNVYDAWIYRLGTGVPQILAKGDVDLGTTSLDVHFGPMPDDRACAPHGLAGAVLTLVRSTGTLTGRFASLPEGAEITPTQPTMGGTTTNPDFCTLYSLRFHYTRHAVEATVIGPAAAPTEQLPTGRRAAAIKRCKQQQSKQKRRKCVRRARRLPV